MSDAIEFAGDPISPREEDLPIAETPEDPTMRDGINVWFFEDSGEFGFPRLAVDAVGPDWEKRMVWSTVVFSSGRLMQSVKYYPAIPVEDEAGKPTVLGCTALKFQCIDPMRKWHMVYDEELTDGDVEGQIAKSMDPSKTSRVKVDAMIEIDSPLWGQYFSEEDERPEAGWMGRGWRYEVPCKVTGTVEFDGKSREFSARGTLVRRKSKRTASVDFPGHCWLHAKFPDGRAFGCNIYPQRVPGAFQYNIGYIYQDGKIHDAKVVEAPWLRNLVFAGEDMPVVLESDLGRTRIEGKSVLGSFKPEFASMGGLNLYQGGVRFTWDDQTAIGMSERSSFTDD